MVKSLILALLLLSGCAVFQTPQIFQDKEIKVQQVQQKPTEKPKQKDDLYWFILWIIISILCGFILGGSKVKGSLYAVLLRLMIKRK